MGRALRGLRVRGPCVGPQLEPGLLGLAVRELEIRQVVYVTHTLCKAEEAGADASGAGWEAGLVERARYVSRGFERALRRTERALGLLTEAVGGRAQQACDVYGLVYVTQTGIAHVFSFGPRGLVALDAAPLR